MAKLIFVLLVVVTLGGCFMYDECRGSCRCWYAKAYSSCGGALP